MNNQPAFPVQSIYIEDQETNSTGMTLRDYFAAKAMQALIARETKLSPDPMIYTGAAYDFADAMLNAREN